MTNFQIGKSYVYIFENTEAQRVKIGMTMNSPLERLDDVNDMWLERTVTCQICGGRTLNKNGHVSQHVVSGLICPGGRALSFEKDISLAESYLENMKKCHSELSGSEKGSITKKIKTIEKRIELYRHYSQPVGLWQFNSAYYTQHTESVEFLTHEILAERLDKQATFGEVFCCSVSEATKAVESVLSQLGLLPSAKKITDWRNRDFNDLYGTQ